MAQIVFLGLGTNLGDRRQNLELSIQSLPPKMKVLARSQIYQSPPWGYVDQPAFLNMAVKAETALEPEALLAYIKEVEITVGRKPTFLYGPRLIDIDILFYSNCVIHSQRLTIPHPLLQERNFVLAPLADLAPDFIHPVTKEKVADLLARVGVSDLVLYG
jgi:2-amino-4-hydroxy-6-hydroxymethyldihydropteridine diphosphokinase